MKTNTTNGGKQAKLELQKKTIVKLDVPKTTKEGGNHYFITWDDITGCTSRMTNDPAKTLK